jgi:MoaA/NifB/PqqE/SkfB family radical SAM enzyme
VTVGFNTNATLLTRRRADELVDTGLDWLHVSLDGADPGTYAGIRRGADLDTVVANLAGLVAAKRAAGSDVPWIRAVFVAMRANVGELPDLVRLLAGVGVNELRVQNLAHTFSDADPSGSYREIRQFASEQALWTGADRASAEAAFTAAGAAARDHGLLLRVPSLDPGPAREPVGAGPVGAGPVGAGPIGAGPARAGLASAGLASVGPACSWPWDAAYITSTGVVQPCCMVMGDDRITLGRLDEQSFPEIWHGEPYRDFRRRLAGENPPDVCVGCAFYQRTF